MKGAAAEGKGRGPSEAPAARGAALFICRGREVGGEAQLSTSGSAERL